MSTYCISLVHSYPEAYMGRAETSIKVSKDTRDRVRRLKVGQESYDELLQRMVRQYEPPEPSEVDP